MGKRIFLLEQFGGNLKRLIIPGQYEKKNTERVKKKERVNRERKKERKEVM